MKRFLVLSYLLLSFSILRTDSIDIFNESDQKIHTAIYYVPSDQSKPVERATNPVSIDPFEFAAVEKPERKKESFFSFYDRDLIVVARAEALKAQLTRAEYNGALKTNVGTLKTWAETLAQAGASPSIAYNIYKATGPAIYFVKENNKPRLLDPALYKIYLQKKTFEDVIWTVKTIKGFSNVFMLTTSKEELEKIRKESPFFTKNPYKDSQAYVSKGNNLGSEESSSLEKRLSKVRPAVEKLLGRSVKTTPRIAMVGSGGGFRAMLCTLGFLTGAQEIGLLDATTWFSSLSGSSWAAGVLYMNEVKSGGTQTVREIRDKTIKMIANKDLYKPLSDHELQLMHDYILARAATLQPFSAVVVWGALLMNRLFENFGDERHMLNLWQMKSIVETGQWPIPIFTAVQGAKGFEREQREWFEFTPWQVGSPWLGCYIPTWAFGRGFIMGKSDFRLAENLGFCLGTFGSAIALSISDIIQEMEKEIDQTSSIKKVGLKALKILLDQFAKLPPEVLAPLMTASGYSATKGGKVSDVRLLGGVTHNFVLQMPQEKLRNDIYLQLIDAGISFNLPYPPISGERPERKADIIIFFDGSREIKESGLVVNQLRLTEQYARRKKLKFPVIDYASLHKKGISIFRDDKDPSVPVVIYLPRLNVAPDAKDSGVLSFWDQLTKPEFAKYTEVKNFDLETCNEDGDCNTLNFKYTEKNARLLSMAAEFNIIAAKDIITKAIDDWIILKEGGSKK